ncbi:phage tail domain-containing protein [Lactococcus protaetiae]|uniref:Phage tail family protein n=1 Tax=Lactococcus protaetiae TaxID=2592653 RepID=A0A514Z6Y1_9LACT|nr:phage tail domain-containing protein [Lactococcus protaetiae]QDK70352.1 phage tail family protein [Lactococcus protaetiae]
MKITYSSSNGDKVEFGQQPPFLVTSIKGLGGVGNIITKQQQYGLDGSFLVNQQLDDRAPGIEGEIIASSSSDLATKCQQLSSLLNPNTAGTLTYYPDNGKIYEIDVLIEQPPVFDEPQNNLTQTFSIDFVALDSYWIDKSQADKLIPLSSVKNKLTFPLRITSGFTFANISSNNIQTIINKGDVSVGVKITLRIISDVVNPKILNVGTGEYFRLEETYSAGTVLTIVTLRGEKEVTGVQADGTMFNALKDWDDDSVFLQLAQGSNFLQLQADEGAANMIGTIQFSPKVIGVK